MISADGIIAADWGGTSDAYAIAELVHTGTGKAVLDQSKRPRKTKTKTVKKTLSPYWDEAPVVWGDIEESLSAVSLKVTLYDADMMTSDTLGGVLVALGALEPGLDPAARPDEPRTFAIEKIGRMKKRAVGSSRQT